MSDKPKTLPTEFTAEGFRFRQVRRCEHVAIYEKTRNGGVSYEVVVIRRSKKDYRFPSGSVVPAGSESYPSNSQWGRLGFTCPDMEAAARKYRQLVETEEANKQEPATQEAFL